MNDLLIDLHASLLRFCVQAATEVAVLTGQPTGAIYFDSYADDATLPAGDQVGLSGLGFQTDSHLVEGSFMIGFTTQTDANLFRLMKGVNLIMKKLIPGGRLDVIRGADGVVMGQLNIVDDTRLLPVGGKANRPIQLIQVSFVTTTAYVAED